MNLSTFFLLFYLETHITRKQMNCPPWSKYRVFFSCPEQLNRWPCHSLTHWLTHSLLMSKLDWCDVWLVKMPTQNLLSLLLLLMLMMRIVLATVCCRFESWGLVIKLNFRLWVLLSRFWSWSLVSILLLMFGWGYEVESWLRFQRVGQAFKFKLSRDTDLWLQFWS